MSAATSLFELHAPQPQPQTTARTQPRVEPVCAVCGYSRDYLLIAEAYEREVRTVLSALFPELG